MSTIHTDLLNDTLNLIQLARETALQQGRTRQAEALQPVAADLKDLASRAPKAPPAVSDTLAESGFQKLLAVAQTRTATNNRVTSAADRRQVVEAMASAGMGEVDIARQMGMTRDEIHLILQVQKGK